MGTDTMLDPTRLIIAALIGLALLLVLIIKFKIHAMISILIGRSEEHTSELQSH